MKSRLSGNEFEYVTRQIRELQLELEVSEDNCTTCYPTIVDTDIEGLSLFKQKYMRQKTFDAIREELEWLIIERLRLWIAMCK